MAKQQIDQQVITKLRATCAGKTDHVIVMAVVATQLETILAALFSRDKQI